MYGPGRGGPVAPLKRRYGILKLLCFRILFLLISFEGLFESV